ncbi:MAG: FKBP-type peptidyl-prolyl cis-trans isomerase [Bacteroidota bacterium]
MLSRFLSVPVAALALLVGCQTGPTDNFSDIADRPIEDQAAYISGYNTGEGIRNQIVGDSTLNIDLDVIAAAFYAGISGDSMVFSDEEMQEIMTAFQDTMILRQPDVKQAGLQADSLLAANAASDSITVTDSGLQYQILAEGSGASPELGDRVLVNYEGRLINGFVFDASERRGESAEFVVGQLVEGWNEALTLMEVGDRWRLWIPADLGYGLRPNPRSGIPPNALLIFDLELVDVTPAGSPDASE